MVFTLDLIWNHHVECSHVTRSHQINGKAYSAVTCQKWRSFWSQWRQMKTGEAVYMGDGDMSGGRKYDGGAGGGAEQRVDSVGVLR